MQNDSFKCVSIMRRIIGVKDPTEELTVHILFTLVVGYFAFAQYDVKSPIGALTRATSPFHRGSLLPGGLGFGQVISIQNFYIQFSFAALTALLEKSKSPVAARGYQIARF